MGPGKTGVARLAAATGAAVVPVAIRQTDDVWPVSKRCLLYTSPSPRDATLSRMPSSA